MRKSTRLLAPLAGSIALFLAQARGVDIQKLNNTDALNLGSSWNAGGAVPGPDDVALFDNAISAQFSVPLGGDLSWQGIRVTNVGGARNTANTNVRLSDGASANTLSLGSAGIDLSAAFQSLVIQSRLTLTADQTWSVANANTAGNPAGFNNGEDLAFQAFGAGVPIDFGGRVLTTTGAGAITITSGYTLSNGTINVGNAFFIIQGGASRVTTVESTVNFNVSVGGVLRFAAQSGSGGLTTQVNAPVTLNAGSLLTFHLNQANTINLTGNVTMAGNANWTVIGGSTGNQTTFSGNLLGSGNINYANTNTEVNGAGVLRMSGDNSGYSGTFTINGASGNRALRITGANAGSANATWSVAANNTLQVDGVTVRLGTLTGAGSITNSHAANPAVIEVGAGTFSGIISSGFSAPMGLTKLGPGTLTLTGANSYTGPTLVSAGTLHTTTAHTGATTVTIADGATLEVALAAAGATHTSEGIASGSLSGATIRLDASGFGNPTAPMLATTTFTPAAPTTFDVVGSNLSSGVFRLLDYVGAIAGGGFGNLSVTLPFRVSGALINNAGDTAIDVSISSETPRWRGDINSDWDFNDGVTGGTLNWRTLTSDTPTPYIQGTNTDVAIFDDTATNTTVNLTTILTPVPGTTVNNPTKTYTFGGPGKLSGASSLTKNGGGTLILANSTAYDYTGGTFINEGTLQIGNGVTAGIGFLAAGSVVNNATLHFNRPDDLTLASALSGSGSLIKDQSNTITFASGVTYGGPITINAGVLAFGAGGMFSNTIDGAGGLTLQAGVMQFAGGAANTYTGLTSVSGGTLQLNKPAGVNAIAGDLLLTGNGALARLQPDQIADTSTIIYDKNANGGSIVLNETVGAINMLNGADLGAQVQANNGFVVAGLLSGANTSVFSVASGHSGIVGGLSLSGSAIIRIAANGNPSFLTVGALGIAASGGTIQVGQGNGAFDAVLNLDGNVATTGDLNFTDGNFAGGQLRQIILGFGPRVFNVGAATTTSIAPDLAGAGGLTKTGDGLLVLTAASTSSYTGSTLVNAGSLVVDGSLSGTSSIDVSGAGTLGGIGGITPALGANVNVLAGGKLSPARPLTPGVMTVNLAGGGALDIEAGVAAANSQALLFDLDSPFFSDKITLTGGPLRIGAGVLEFDDFAFTPGFSFDTLATFTLFDGDSAIIGSLGPQTIGLISGQNFELQLADGGNDLVLVSVPEPASSTLLLCAAGMLGLRRRRQ